MFHDFKSEIKLFLIVALVAALSVGGIFLLQGVGLGPSSPTSVPVSAKAISALSTVRSMRIFLF
ncbi:MAG: hypothetical protein A2940_00645 [Candidatus Wildermuthbacteria bacterium RIFCSPLOWO2_01_FULL_48_29]|uniref:Uncharacterized protein n=2 Tax=Parcubacteria group TaxID=1794811 RepID=A0A1G2RJX1_9BACT|nr:MAG: hypothetical protein A2669_00655 [Candidatus Yanofskybacteria bacterium RIFCSPHIGHO2_01_FULL_48_25b]OHA73136.1 MAG: hypothetical protein A2940_00645 [Candidatus Wildermuthbacteria bacterium RIFCSPLOWO2_01_FULL_48_29]